MHPEIQNIGPGRCPICGMSLEPLDGGIEDDSAVTELKEMTRRFWISVPLSSIVLLTSQIRIPNSVDLFVIYGQLIIAGIVVYWLSAPIQRWAIDSIKNKNLNMWTLIGIGVNAAYLFSVFSTLFPGAIPNDFLNAGKVPNYFEAASVICTLTLLGQVFELRARASSGASIRSLLKLTSDKAWLVNEVGDEIQVNLSSIQVGNVLRVKPGEQIPVDGKVIRGFTSVDESMISGEPIPVEKQVNEKVIAGTLNLNGSIEIKVEELGSDTLLSRIIEMVAVAQRTKAPMQKLADKIATYFVTAVLIIALGTFLVWGLFGQTNSWGFGFINAISVLIIACPCALGLATPMSVMNGTELGARHGVIFRDASAIEQLSKIDILVIDKTGTLTFGKPTVVNILSVSQYDENEIVAFAAAANESSEHPLAKALKNFILENKIDIQKVENFEAIPGFGVKASLQSGELLVGNRDLMVQVNVHLQNQVINRESSNTEMFVSLNKSLLGVIYFDDKLKPTTIEAAREIRILKKRIAHGYRRCRRSC